MGQGQSSVQKHVLHEYQLQHHMSSMTDGRSSRFPHVALARRTARCGHDSGSGGVQRMRVTRQRGLSGIDS